MRDKVILKTNFVTFKSTKLESSSYDKILNIVLFDIGDRHNISLTQLLGIVVLPEADNLFDPIKTCSYKTLYFEAGDYYYTPSAHLKFFEYWKILLNII